jgi:hypothetical protein
VTMASESHRHRRMIGRDPHERHRAATPLELLFDLTFVVAFGAAGNELAHALAEKHVTSGPDRRCGPFLPADRLPPFRHAKSRNTS